MSYRGRGRGWSGPPRGGRGGGASGWDAKRKRPNPDSDDEMEVDDFPDQDEMFADMAEEAEYGEMSASSAATASKEHWKRPPVASHNTFKDSLVFQQLDIDHYIGKVSCKPLLALLKDNDSSNLLNPPCLMSGWNRSWYAWSNERTRACHEDVRHQPRREFDLLSRAWLPSVLLRHRIAQLWQGESEGLSRRPQRRHHE